jgi:hypothetical protein
MLVFNLTVAFAGQSTTFITEPKTIIWLDAKSTLSITNRER